MRAAALAAASMVAAACAFAGWTWLNKDQTYAPDTPLAEQCDDVQTGAERITLVRDDGTTLGGALVGRPDAEVGVVLRQGAGQTICDWLPWASDLADATGVRVLLFDRRGRGSSPGEADLSAEPADLAAAADFLHRRGIEEVALAGSSMGNSVMFAALDQMAPAPCAIVAISPILVSSDSHGTVDGTPMARLPDNIWVTWEELNPDVVANAKLIQSAASRQDLPAPHVLPVETSDHSIGLLEKHDEVRDFVIDATRSC